MNKFWYRFAIVLMSVGAAIVLTFVVAIAIVYENRAKEDARVSACEETTAVMATTALCLKDKDFKCFVTPKDYREFAGAVKKHKDNQCEVK